MVDVFQFGDVIVCDCVEIYVFVYLQCVGCVEDQCECCVECDLEVVLDGCENYYEFVDEI